MARKVNDPDGIGKRVKQWLDRARRWALGFPIAAGAAFRSACLKAAGIAIGVGLMTHYQLEAYGPDGRLKWRDSFYNLVVTAGLNDNLDKHFKGSSYTAAWYVGITAASPSFNAADTMSSHGGWTEVAAYSESVRQTLTLGSVAGGSVSNSASKAVFSINANSTGIGGAFITTSNTKSGTTGTLYGGGAFSGGNKTLDSGDTLNVTVTLTAAAA